ncbi:diacylglycerol kinase family protein [Desulfitobacterium sp. Sab5]|uniref:diacylglycerol kinase family protein n=1 Tax=Desulfitobacterium nosdiversum TaxID=3375356 RepID=UPI003CEED604
MGKYSEKHSKNRSFWVSLGQAWRGILYSFKTQKHFQFHIFAGSIVIISAWLTQLTRLEWVLLVIAIGCVLAAEVINTAIELVVDLVQPNYHPIAGMAKDVAAGAVLIAAIQAVVIGLLIFGPPLMRWIMKGV